jgi:putative ABC transport system permease protein
VDRRKFESDLNEEIADFLERDTRDRIAHGETRETAERSARSEMRGVQQTKERVRELRPGVWVENLWWDIRFAARTLTKSPGYVFVAVLTMALGIGANTAIFSLLHAVLLQPLPFREPDRLVLLQTQAPESVAPQVSYLDFIDVSNQHPGIENATLFLNEAFVVEHANTNRERRPMRLYGLRVSSDFFQTLGVHPSIGRGFVAEDFVPGKDQVVVIRQSLFRDRFENPNKILGRELVINEQPHIIIGVMPDDFDLFLPLTDSFVIQDIDILVPFPKPPEYALHRSVFMFEAIARIRKNTTQQQAENDLLLISQRLAKDHPDTNGSRSIRMTQLSEYITAGSRPALYLLTAAVLVLLLAACANLANLMIGRMAAREKELSICAALGASRLRLLRRLLIESMLMVGLGGVAGIALARALLPLITERLAAQAPGVSTISLNAPVMLFAVIVCLMTGTISGILPARPLWSRKQSNHTLSRDARTTAGSGQAKLRKSLVVFEIAVSCVLLAGAILLSNSFLSLMRVHLGFDSEELLTFQVRLSESRYETRKQVAQTMSEFTRRIAAIPGVKNAAATSSLPLTGHNTGTAVWVEGRMPSAGKQPPEARWQFVQPEYFETMGIPLIRGRFFEERDLLRKTHVTVISESVALRDFPNENPVGKRVSYGPPVGETDWHEIIGVVGDVRHGEIREQMVPRTYDLLGQHADLSFFVIVKGEVTSQIMPSVVAILSRIDPGAPVYDVRTMEEWKARSIHREQTLATVVGFFAIAALFLGAIGAYGVISSLVAQRTKEIGIRMSLGASPKKILQATIAEGLRLAIAGLLIGIFASIPLATLLRGILFGIKFTDPRTYVLIAVLLILVALVASFIPARRASRVDPIHALRQE